MTQPKALRLAEELEKDWNAFDPCFDAAKELRRLHKENQALRQALVQTVGTRLYTAPPKREWVGLTEEEFFDFLNFGGRLDHVETPLIADFIRTIQAKLKEKNT